MAKKPRKTRPTTPSSYENIEKVKGFISRKRNPWKNTEKPGKAFRESLDDPRGRYAPLVARAILERVKPIVAQRKKDQEKIYLHTVDEEIPPSVAAVVSEAIEFYCDLLLPIDSTPFDRLVDDDIPAIRPWWVPHTEYHAERRPVKEYNKKLLERVKEILAEEDGPPSEEG